MKRNLRLITVIIGGTLTLGSASAQLKEVDFIKGGLNDAEILFTEYLAPWANAFGANLNGGWYNTAKPHKLGGFDVTFTVNAAWAPPSAKTMDLNSLGLEATVLPTTGGSTVAPTIAGKQMDERPMLSYTLDNPASPGNQITLAEYEVANGTGWNLVPVPMAQASVGLPFGTEITGRFLPNLKIGSAGNINLWGIGLKHDIFQHIPVLKKLPVLNVSAQGGFTKMNTKANVNFEPDSYALNLVTDNQIFNGQKIEMDVTAWTVNLVASQNLPVITFYEGIGYSNTNTKVLLAGNYPISRLETDPGNDYFGQVVVTDDDVIEDPLDMEINNSKDLRLNIGFRIKLGVLTIHGDYTKANYSLVTAGLGISFR